MSSLWEINCGTGVQTRQCGVDLTEAADIRNENAEPLPVLAECSKVLSPTKAQWKYTCDRNQNGVADEDELTKLIVVNQNKFHDIDFNCGTHDDCFGCTDEELAGFVTNKETENPGSIIYECVETLWGTEKARYRYACDNNLNGIIDEGDQIKEYIVKQSDSGCTRNQIIMNCKTSATTASTTTNTVTTTMPELLTDKCYNCFNLGTQDGSAFNTLLANLNPEPHAPTLSCLGVEDENENEDLPENTGRFLVGVHCDLNNDGVVDEGEKTMTLTGKKRSQTYCGAVSPGSWEIDCGYAACSSDACSVADVLTAPTLFSWDENIPIGAECLGQNVDKNSENDFRFYCDENNNGVFDEGEKNVINGVHRNKDCGSHETGLICGKSPTGQCSPFPAFSCKTEDVLTSPNTDWYDLNTGNKNVNWENLFVFRQNGYDGNIAAECSEIINEKNEMWTLWCDDNNNGILDVDEKTIQTKVTHQKTVGKTDSTWTCAFEELRYKNNFVCGDFEPTLRDVLTTEEDFTSRGIEPKALKQCGFKYMGPRYYGAPQSNEYDKETGVCTDEGMQNAYWETRTAGNPIVGGAGFIQQGLGRDYPYALAYNYGYANKKKPEKAPELERFYDEAMSQLYNHYIPCYKEMDKLGGNIIQYTQMYSLSKGERLFGWDTRNLLDISNEAYLFYMRGYIDGLFYDISPIQEQMFWRQWDYTRMNEIHTHTSNLWADYSDLDPTFMTNSGDVDAFFRGGATLTMGYEGQLGVLPSWTNTTYYKKDPITANTLWAQSNAHGADAAHFIYGNQNYQQKACARKLIPAVPHSCAKREVAQLFAQANLS